MPWYDLTMGEGTCDRCDDHEVGELCIERNWLEAMAFLVRSKIRLKKSSFCCSLRLWSFMGCNHVSRQDIVGQELKARSCWSEKKWNIEDN